MTEKQVKEALAAIRAAVYKLEQHFVEEELAKKGGPSPRPLPLDEPHDPPHPSPHESPKESPHPPP